MQTCLLSPVGYPMSAVSSWGRGEGWMVEGRRGVGGRGAYLNQPVVPALRPTCQQPSDSRFLFHSVSQSLSGSTFPSLPLPVNRSFLIYLSASHPLYSFNLLQLQHYKTNNSHLGRCASIQLSFSFHSKL